VVGLVVLWNSAVVAAQEKPTAQEEPIHTLHVYTNLIQIPTLVLGPNRDRLKTPIAENRFSVSIDSGPWFRATHVRQEGDDPISLSILLDVTGDSSELMPRIDAAIADLAPLALHPKDHVSIYALDCSLVRSLNDAPAESGRLKLAVNTALESWTIRKKRHEPKCQRSVFWDALAHLASELYQLPGRRVILAVTDGRDKGSRHTWKDVTTYAGATGVAVFGVTYFPAEAVGGRSQFLRWSSEDPFHSLCELSGGLVLLSTTTSLDLTLQRFVAMLRERYIVEFPRPANTTSGQHAMNVQVAKSNYFIRPAGISVPIPDVALLTDPTTVPSDPSRTPELGTRKPMMKPH